MTTTVTTTYLEIRDPAAIVSPRRPPPDTALQRAQVPSPELGRFLYTAVGGGWYWQDRLVWTWSEWHRHLSHPAHELWYPTLRGTPAGCFELDASAPPDVELTTFGLLPGFIGRGIGGWLLEAALRRGFELGDRVWLHTCTLDHPNALANYQARGMTTFRVETHQVTVPAEPPGPWPAPPARPRRLHEPR